MDTQKRKRQRRKSLHRTGDISTEPANLGGNTEGSQVKLECPLPSTSLGTDNNVYKDPVVYGSRLFRKPV